MTRPRVLPAGAVDGSASSRAQPSIRRRPTEGSAATRFVAPGGGSIPAASTIAMDSNRLPGPPGPGAKRPAPGSRARSGPRSRAARSRPSSAPARSHRRRGRPESGRRGDQRSRSRDRVRGYRHEGQPIERIWRMTETYSRVRESGRAYGTPCQPSTT